MKSEGSCAATSTQVVLAKHGAGPDLGRNLKGSWGPMRLGKEETKGLDES